MPTNAELERLEALVDRLGPIGDKQRGSLIEAGDWNALVSSLVEVARAVLADERTEHVPAHEHADQVGVGWLDAKLSELVLGGPLADPAAKAQLGKLERQISALAGRLDDLDGANGLLRARIGEVSTRDLAREADLTRFGRKVEGLGDAREDVTDLRVTLRSLELDVRRAVDVSRQLEVDGEVVDIAGLVERVSSVEALRTSLTTPQGELLDAAGFERRLNELRTSLVTEDELDEALSTVRTGGIDLDDLRNSLAESTRQIARETASASVDSFGSELRLEINGRLASLDGSIDARLADATGDLEQSVLAAARSEIEGAVSAGDDALRSELESLIGSRIDTVSRRTTRRINQISAGLEGQITALLDERLPRALEGFEGQIRSFEEQLAGTQEQLQLTDAMARSMATRVATVRRTGDRARSQMQSELNGRIDALDAANQARLDASVAELREGLRADLRGDLEGTRRELERTLNEAARAAALAEVRVVSSQLRGEMREVAAEEISSARDQLGASIDARFAASERRITGIVASEVRRATGGLAQLVRTEVEAFRPELDRMIDTRLGELGRINQPPIVDRPIIDQPIGDGPIVRR